MGGAVEKYSLSWSLTFSFSATSSRGRLAPLMTYIGRREGGIVRNDCPCRLVVKYFWFTGGGKTMHIMYVHTEIPGAAAPCTLIPRIHYTVDWVLRNINILAPPKLLFAFDVLRKHDNSNQWQREHQSRNCIGNLRERGQTCPKH